MCVCVYIYVRVAVAAAAAIRRRRKRPPGEYYPNKCARLHNTTTSNSGRFDGARYRPLALEALVRGVERYVYRAACIYASVDPDG